MALLLVSFFEPHLMAQGQALHEPHAHHGPSQPDAPDFASPYCFFCILPLANLPTPEAAASRSPLRPCAHRPAADIRVLARPGGSIKARAPPARHA